MTGSFCHPKRSGQPTRNRQGGKWCRLGHQAPHPKNKSGNKSFCRLVIFSIPLDSTSPALRATIFVSFRPSATAVVHLHLAVTLPGTISCRPAGTFQRFSHDRGLRQQRRDSSLPAFLHRRFPKLEAAIRAVAALPAAKTGTLPGKLLVVTA